MRNQSTHHRLQLSCAQLAEVIHVAFWFLQLQSRIIQVGHAAVVPLHLEHDPVQEELKPLSVGEDDSWRKKTQRSLGTVERFLNHFLLYLLHWCDGKWGEQ